MKFRAKFGSPGQLSKLVLSLSKLGGTCLVQLTPDQISFAVAPEGTDSSMVVADLRQTLFFIEWKIESRAENNRISFFAKLENLTRALKSVKDNSETTHKKGGVPGTAYLKLSKKDGVPMLSFDIRIGDQANVQHDVPLRLVQGPEEIRAYSEPQIDDTANAVTVLLPYSEIKGLKNVVERMKSVSDKLRLTAQGAVSRADYASAVADGGAPVLPGAGQLELVVQKDNQVTIRTTYPKLGLMLTSSAPEEALQDGDEDVRLEAEATISIKRLSRVLQALVAADCKMHCGVLCLVPGHVVLLKLYLSDNQRQSTSEWQAVEPTNPHAKLTARRRLDPTPHPPSRSDILPPRHALSSVHVGRCRLLGCHLPAESYTGPWGPGLARTETYVYGVQSIRLYGVDVACWDLS